MRSQSHAPVMLRGTTDPDRKTILFSTLRLHLPSRMYSDAISLSRIKCPMPPQKLHLSLGFASFWGHAIAGALAWAWLACPPANCACAAKTVLNISVISDIALLTAD